MSEELRPYGTDSTDPPAEPLTREEQYLSAIAGVTSSSDIPPKPLTRAEKYLNKIVENGGGGGGGGTTNYNDLSNRPQVEDKTLEGNMSLSDLGAQAALDTNQMAAVNSGVTSTDVEQIGTNKNNISSIQNGTYWGEYIHGNLFTIATDKISGSYYYYNTNTNKIVTNTSSNLSCFILKVDKNTDYTCDNARFLLHMSSKEDVTSSAQYVTSFNSGNDEYVAISYNQNNYPNYEISKGNKTESGEITYEIPWLYHPLPTYKNGIIQTKAESVASGNTRGITEQYDLQRNYTIECTCDFETFGSIEIFKGTSSSTYLSRLIIDDTNYTIYNGTTKTVEAAHGLTFADYITVVIVYKDTGNATIKINTSTGSFSVDNISWYGYGGTANFKSITGTYTNMVLSMKSLDFNKPVSIFGDSYVNTRNNERWLYYLKELGFDQYLISSYPGASSSDEIQSFRNVIARTNPKIVLWAIGMNDGSDTTTYPEAWKSAIDEVIETCDENGIELVLATIPCVPSINNAYKNAYVKSTGKRYIDFAKAVGAETSGSTWYTGMLSSDNVHPTALGANALAAQAMIDMPELMSIV